MIPVLTSEGRLPVGRHAATLAEIRVVFVESAPNPERRRLIWRAFELYTELVWDLLPGAKLWVDGGFVTHKPEPPKDVDVAVIGDAAGVDGLPFEALAPLTTRSRVTFHDAIPISLRRLQPMGGLVDGFFVPAGNTAAENYWDKKWTEVRDEPESAKGYLEVAPP